MSQVSETSQGSDARSPISWVTSRSDSIESWILYAVAALGLLLIAASCLLWAFLRIPTFPGDEYAYWAAAEGRLWGVNPNEIDPGLQSMSQPLYIALISWLQGTFSEPYPILKTLNLAFFAIGGILFAGAVGRGLSPLRRAVLMVLAIATPFLVFIISAMAEALFALLVGAALALITFWFARRPMLASVGAALLLGQAMMVKPHAIAAMAGVVVLIAALGGFRSDSRFQLARIPLLVGAFLAAAVASVIFGAWLWSADHVVSAKTIFGEMYASILQSSTKSAPRIDVLAYYLSGNFVAATVIAGPAVFLPVAALMRGNPLKNIAASPALTGWAVAGLALGASVLMASQYSVTSGSNTPFESSRIFARYYGVYAMYAGIAAMAFILMTPSLPKMVSRISLGVFAAAALVFAFWVMGAFKVFPWDAPWFLGVTPLRASHMSRGGPFDIALYVAPLLVMAVVVGMVFVNRIATAAATFGVAMASASLIALFWWVDGRVVELRPMAEEAEALATLVGPARSPYEGVLVGSDRYGPMALAMFATRAPSRALIEPPDTPLTAAKLGPGIKWVLTIRDYPIAFPYRASVQGKYAALYVLGDKFPTVAEPDAVEWDGATFLVNLADGGDWGRADGFNPPEGDHSSTRDPVAWVLLPYMISGPVKISVAAWSPSGPGQTAVVVMNGQRQEFQPDGAQKRYDLAFDLAAPASRISIEYPSARPNDWSNRSGLAVSAIEVARSGR